MLLDDTIGGREVCPRGIGVLHGLDEADAGRLAFLDEHLRLPVPAGAIAEVPLGYWPDGNVRRVEGGAGRYVDEGQILSGTIDVMWADETDNPEMCPEGSTLWIVDWKTGAEEHVPPVDRNWQLRGAAVLAARWTGAQRVIPAICYVNAGECAEAVRANVSYQGRWEVGAPLDAAALDAVEAEMRAVLARARGEGDGRAGVHAVPRRGQVVGGEVHPDRADEGAALGQRVDQPSVGPLILGPHCDHCPARGACPALAAEAVTLLGALEGEDDGQVKMGPEVQARAAASASEASQEQRADAQPVQAEGASAGAGEVPPARQVALPVPALTPARAAHLAAIIPALRSVLDAAEVAVRAHVHATGRPLTLANGQEYGPAVEEVRHYRTAETFEALAARVGDARANEAFVATPDRLKAALRGDAARLPRGAWAAFEEELEARGAVVVGAREVWRKRWSAKPAEVDDVHREMGGREPGRVAVHDQRRDEARVQRGVDVEAVGGAEVRDHGGGTEARRTPSVVAPEADQDPPAQITPAGRYDAADGAAAPPAPGPLADAPPMAPGAVADDVPPGVRDEAPADGGAGVAAPGAANGGPARALDGGRPTVSRAPCSVCGCDVAVTPKGNTWSHAAPGVAIRCKGSGHPPARAPEQLQIGGA
jgi:hypothetical protein